MDERVRRLAEQLLDTGLDQLPERERRVITRVAERSQISRDVNRAFDAKQTFGDRLADRVARFGGSWTFIILFLGTLVAWAILNSVVLAWYSTAFDPYPYIFLNLMLSMLACIAGASHPDVTEPPGGAGPPGRWPRLRGQFEGRARDHGAAREAGPDTLAASRGAVARSAGATRVTDTADRGNGKTGAGPSI
jgi:hypothetical protein